MYCVYLLFVGGEVVYAGSSGEVERRIRRHVCGTSSAVAKHRFRPERAVVLACARGKSLALSWEAYLHRVYSPRYAERAPDRPPRRPPRLPYTPADEVKDVKIYKPAEPREIWRYPSRGRPREPQLRNTSPSLHVDKPAATDKPPPIT